MCRRCSREQSLDGLGALPSSRQFPTPKARIRSQLGSGSFFCLRRSAFLPGIAGHLLLPLAAKGSCTLDGSSFTGLYVMPTPSEFAEETGLLELPLKDLERSLQAVLVTQLHFSHSGAPIERESKGAGASASPLEAGRVESGRLPFRCRKKHTP